MELGRVKKVICSINDSAYLVQYLQRIEGVRRMEDSQIGSSHSNDQICR